MAEIKLEEIRSAAFELIDENQDFKIGDSSETLLYTLAYNDGVISLFDKLSEKFFPTIIKFDPREAADDKE